MASALPGFSQDAVTTVYIVRHADRLGTSDALSDDGFDRAKELAHVLQDASLTAIFVSEFKRTQQTAAPTAEATGIEPKQYPSAQAVADDILTNHIGGRILVVGHSNTVDDIAAGLGADGVPQLASGQFDRLFVVHLAGGEAHLDVLRYGESTD